MVEFPFTESGVLTMHLRECVVLKSLSEAWAVPVQELGNAEPAQVGENNGI
jgi:hypothetical protein